MTARPSFGTLLRGVWTSTGERRGRAFVFVGMMIVAYAVDLLVPWAIGFALGEFVYAGTHEDGLYRAFLGVLAFAGLQLLGLVLHHVARYLQAEVAYVARARTYQSTLTHLLWFPLRWHVANHSGDSLAKLHRGANAIDGVVGFTSWQVIDGGLKLVLATLAVATLDPLVALVVLVMGGLTVVLIVAFNRLRAPLLRELNDYGNRINRVFVDALANARTIKMLGAERFALSRFLAVRDDAIAASNRSMLYNELRWGVSGLGYTLAIGLCLALYFRAEAIPREPVDLATAYVLLNYLDRIFASVTAFAGYSSSLFDAAVGYEDTARIADEATRARTTAPLVPSGAGTLSVRGATFTYANGAGIRDITLDLPPSTRIGVVGASGGGKSTLLRMLAGMATPVEGELRWRDEPVQPADRVSGLCCLVPQEPEIFSASIRDNVALGEAIPATTLDETAAHFRLDGLLARLPAGWDTDLAEHGANLSVGEKQRIALARALLKLGDRPLLLLDEPTSSLDAATEWDVFHGLLDRYRDRTIVTAFHRLHLAPQFDHLVVLDAGRIVEQGTFDELVAKDGPFAGLWAAYQRSAEGGPVRRPVSTPP